MIDQSHLAEQVAVAVHRQLIAIGPAVVLPHLHRASGHDVEPIGDVPLLEHHGPGVPVLGVTHRLQGGQIFLGEFVEEEDGAQRSAVIVGVSPPAGVA